MWQLDEQGLQGIKATRIRKMTLCTYSSENSYKHDKLPDDDNHSSHWYCSIKEEIKRHELMYTSIAWIISSFLKEVPDNTVLPAFPYSCHTWHYELKILLCLQICKRLCLCAAIYFMKFLNKHIKITFEQ